MKTRRTILCGIFAMLISLAFGMMVIGCDDGGGGGDTHTHTWSTTWSYDATQHWYECTANDGAKKDTANHTITSNTCTDCGYDSTATLVTFSTVTANGSASATTTTLTLTFSAAITGLSASDITLTGVEGVQKGTLTNSGSTYTLPISDFTAGGTLTVKVEKTNYNISGSSKTVAIYYYTDWWTWVSPAGETYPSTADVSITPTADDTGCAVTVTGTANASGFNWAVQVGRNYTAQAGKTYRASWKWKADSNTFEKVCIQYVQQKDYQNQVDYQLGTDANTLTIPTTEGTVAFEFTLPASLSAYLTQFIFRIGEDSGSFTISDFKVEAITPTGPTNWTAVANSAFGSATDNSSNINAIAYGGGKFVAGGMYGKMAYSTDGTSWTDVADKTIWEYTELDGSKAYRNIFVIAYANNKFVAGSENGKMATSTDGVSWTAAVTPDQYFTPYAITYGGDKWVAGGYEGKIATSSDGTTWTAVTDSTFSTFGTFGISAIAYGNNKFVAGGSEGGKMAYSTDGTTWTAVANSTFVAGIHAIAYGNNKFVAVGPNGKMATSTDGATWTAVANSTFGFSDNIGAIAYGNNRFVAGSENGKTTYSTDGTTWTAIANSTFGSDYIGAIAYGNNRFVAVGSNGKMAYADWEE